MKDKNSLFYLVSIEAGLWYDNKTFNTSITLFVVL